MKSQAQLQVDPLRKLPKLPKAGLPKECSDQNFIVCRLGQASMSILDHSAVMPGADRGALHLLCQGQDAAQRATLQKVPTP